MKHTLPLLIAFSLFISSAQAETPPPEWNHFGFDMSNSLIPPTDVHKGCPATDCIPAIDDPEFVASPDAAFMQPDDLVVAVTMGGETRGYPLRVLVWHEIVNDTIQGRPLAITYCPLCGTSMVFDRTINGIELSFGVSGMLYQSDVLMYDRQTRSLWSQLAVQSVSGPQAGTPLKWLPSEHMTWAKWLERYPDSKVLSTNTGHTRNYDKLPYGGYEKSDRILFPVPLTRDDLGNKEWIAGVVIGGSAKAYPLAKLPSGEWIEDTVGGTAIRVRYDAVSREFSASLADSGEALPAVQAYWFAWQAFYPGTTLWSPPAN